MSRARILAEFFPCATLAQQIVESIELHVQIIETLLFGEFERALRREIEEAVLLGNECLDVVVEFAIAHVRRFAAQDRSTGRVRPAGGNSVRISASTISSCSRTSPVSSAAFTAARQSLSRLSCSVGDSAFFFMALLYLSQRTSSEYEKKMERYGSLKSSVSPAPT